MSVDMAVIAVGCALGVGCFLGAVAYWWQGVKARYDASPIGPEPAFDDKEMRRLMKETSAEMEETGEWWGYRWSK